MTLTGTRLIAGDHYSGVCVCLLAKSDFIVIVVKDDVILSVMVMFRW